jgi:hypothetical protein
MDLNFSGYDPVAGFCEHGNGSSDSCRKFLGQMRNYKLFKEDPAQQD